MKLEHLQKKHYQAFDLTESSREELQKHFIPKYANFIGHHITYAFGVDKDAGVPASPSAVEVVGYVDDGKGVEALVVSIDGDTKRSDGKTYHITWSLEPGRKPVESNSVIENFGYKKLDQAISIEVTPALH